MAKCPTELELQRFFDQELFESDYSRHLESCLKCKEVLAQWKAQGDWIRNSVRVIDDPFFINRVEKRIRSKRHWYWRPTSLSAAAALILVVIGSLFLLRQSSPPESFDQLLTVDEVEEYFGFSDVFLDLNGEENEGGVL